MAERFAALEAGVKALEPLPERVAALEAEPEELPVEALERAYLDALEKECGELIPAVSVKFEKRIRRDAAGRAVGIIEVPAEG